MRAKLPIWPPPFELPSHMRRIELAVDPNELEYVVNDLLEKATYAAGAATGPAALAAARSTPEALGSKGPLEAPQGIRQGVLQGRTPTAILAAPLCEAGVDRIAALLNSFVHAASGRDKKPRKVAVKGSSMAGNPEYAIGRG